MLHESSNVTSIPSISPVCSGPICFFNVWIATFYLFSTQHHLNLFFAFCLMCQFFSEFLPSIVLRPFLATELENEGERKEYVNPNENLSLILLLKSASGKLLVRTLD